MSLWEGRGGCRPTGTAPVCAQSCAVGGWGACRRLCKLQALGAMSHGSCSPNAFVLPQARQNPQPTQNSPSSGLTSLKTASPMQTCLWKSPAHHTLLPWSRRWARAQHGLLMPRNCPSPCTSLKVPAVSSGLLMVSAAPQSQPCPLQTLTCSRRPYLSLSLLKDLLVRNLCHQMVTAHGHFCAEPQHDAEAKDAAGSLSPPGAGDGFPHFLPFPSTFLDKGLRTCALLMQSCRKPCRGTSSHRGAACPL